MNRTFLMMGAFALSMVTACSGSSKSPSDAALYPYRAEGTYAPVLVDCVSATETSESCRLDVLPTLGMVTPEPTIDDVLDRLVVSDDWMGDNFEALLEALPEDILYLMQGVTAVVIGRDIRPSYYWNLTGAIYLDPGNLWLDIDQREVISTDPDYREAYADPMSFRSFWRWSKNSGGAWSSQGPDVNGIRPVTDIVYPMASLLYHELAHANDLLPPAGYDVLSMSDTVYAASNKLRAQFPSTLLKNDSSLESEAMFHFASILYRGLTPSEEDKATGAAEVGSYFEPDYASDDYNYTSQYEDLAMLFEEAMMKISFGIDRDMAFVTPPEGEVTRCDDYIVGWGVRNRVGDVNVLPRAEFAVQALLPHRDYSEELAALPLPSSMPSGAGWCEAITLQRLFAKPLGADPFRQVPILPEHSERLYPVFKGP